MVEKAYGTKQLDDTNLDYTNLDWGQDRLHVLGRCNLYVMSQCDIHAI